MFSRGQQGKWKARVGEPLGFQRRARLRAEELALHAEVEDPGGRGHRPVAPLKNRS